MSKVYSTTLTLQQVIQDAEAIVIATPTAPFHREEKLSFGQREGKDIVLMKGTFYFKLRRSLFGKIKHKKESLLEADAPRTQELTDERNRLAKEGILKSHEVSSYPTKAKLDRLSERILFLRNTSKDANKMNYEIVGEEGLDSLKEVEELIQKNKQDE